MKKDTSINKEYLNIQDASEYMSVCVRSFNYMIKYYGIPVAKFKGIRGGRYRKSDLDKLIESYFYPREIRLQ